MNKLTTSNQRILFIAVLLGLLAVAIVQYYGLPLNELIDSLTEPTFWDSFAGPDPFIEPPTPVGPGQPS